ncbi:hypothetical protein SRHO_G00284180 [Serrasalmus rhombeus]
MQTKHKQTNKQHKNKHTTCKLTTHKQINTKTNNMQTTCKQTTCKQTTCKQHANKQTCKQHAKKLHKRRRCCLDISARSAQCFPQFRRTFRLRWTAGLGSVATRTTRDVKVLSWPLAGVTPHSCNAVPTAPVIHSRESSSIQVIKA